MNNKQIDYIYSMYRNQRYVYKTLYNGEIFLSYPRNFNDLFDCKVLIEEYKFEKEFLRLRIDEKLYNYICSRMYGYGYEENEHKIFREIEMIQLALKHGMEPDIPIEIEDIDIKRLRQDCGLLLKDYMVELDKVCNQYGIACFTLNKPENNIAMWAHYADRYEGICAKYNLEYIHELDQDIYHYELLRRLEKVKYTYKFKCIDVSKLLKIPIEKVADNSYVNSFVQKILNVKHMQWKNENEYRLIINKNDKTIPKTYEDEKGFKIKFDFLSEIYLFSDKQGKSKLSKIKKIVQKYKIGYRLLTLSKGKIGLVDDEEIANRYKLKLDLLEFEEANKEIQQTERDDITSRFVFKKI